MQFKIQLREFVSRRLNGDRDRSGGSACSDYKLVLIKAGAETVLAEFAGFDSFYCHHNPAARVREAAESALNEKAAFFGAEVLPLARFQPEGENLIQIEKPKDEAGDPPRETKWVQA